MNNPQISRGQSMLVRLRAGEAGTIEKREAEWALTAESIETESRIAIAIKEQGGTILESLVLDPSDLVSRDQLFSEARSSAEQLASASQPCG